MRSLHRSTRRQFLGQTAAITAPLLVPGLGMGFDEKPGPNSRINLGVIGTGNQGTNDMKAFLGDNRVQVVAVCDVNRESPGYWDGKVAGRGIDAMLRAGERRVADALATRRSPLEIDRA